MSKDKSGTARTPESNQAAITTQGNGTAAATTQATAAKTRKPRPPSQWSKANPEPKHVKFSRLAKHRLLRAKKAILSLVPLSNGAAYYYENHQSSDIIGRLENWVADVKRAFDGKAEKQPEHFDW